MPATIPCLDLHFPPLAGQPALPDLVSAALHDLAPAAVHEGGADAAPVWRVFLADLLTLDAAAAVLEAQFGAAGLTVSRALADGQDWAARSQAHLTRVRVGEITIAPPWDAAPPPGGVLVIVLPSTGFGTGHHQTTRLCLGLLQQTPIAGRRVLDLGTGSGVLALAAWRLGAAEVEALDYDADAIANARENLRLNAATGAITLRRADLAVDPVAAADVVVANLTGAAACRHAAIITGLVRPVGVLILSGILADELGAVRSAFSGALTITGEAAEDEWRALRAVNGQAGSGPG